MRVGFHLETGAENDVPEGGTHAETSQLRTVVMLGVVPLKSLEPFEFHSADIQEMKEEVGHVVDHVGHQEARPEEKGGQGVSEVDISDERTSENHEDECEGRREDQSIPI